MIKGYQNWKNKRSEKMLKGLSNGTIKMSINTQMHQLSRGI